jgi:hypothetical protein
MKAFFNWNWSALCLGAWLVVGATQVVAQDPKPEYPPLDQVINGFEEIKVIDDEATGTEVQPFYRLWVDHKNGKVLAELPKDFANPDQRHFIATTLSGGDVFAGLQSDDYYVYWKQYGKRLALVAEDVSIRGSDDESKASVQRLFTDRILVDLPILTMVPRGGPVISLDELLVNNSSVFFSRVRTNKPNLSKIKVVKAFPKNVEVAFEIADTNNQLKVLHYSISKIEGTPGFKPRVADQRVGYFTTNYDDYGKYQGDDTRVRYINRWNLEKRDPSLKMSPPKKQIVFYIEHTTPVRYRRWVREGVLHWNKAFEQIGIVNAIDVRQQDKQTGEHMNKDPEDVRYNFIRWLNNNISTAIGPSRVNPKTGEILDADIVLTDGWIRAFEQEFDKVMPKIAMESATTETMAWYAQNPNWDPRIRLASPGKRDAIGQSLMKMNANLDAAASRNTLTRLLGDEPYDGLFNRTSQVNGACFAAEGRQFDVAMMRMALAHAMFDDKDKKDENDKGPEEQILDGMPESFIGPLLADLVCHEVGHTLGLRHNFKASSIYTLDEINSEEIKGKKPFAGSVMDYIPVNFRFESGTVQGDYSMIGIGPYDMWAIEYGYTPDDKKLPEILKRVAEPELIFGTDEDTMGSDPLARRYDFSKNPLDYGKSQVKLALHHREKILEKFVKDGEPWERARRGYLLTLSMQLRSTSTMANWIGGAHINRDKKGDPNGRRPIEPVSAAAQRDALGFVIENTFKDEAFGLTPELLQHLVSDAWFEGGRSISSLDPPWPVHDQISGVQATALSQLLNPTALRRVYDNEFRVPADEDAFTLNELMSSIHNAIWSEIGDLPQGQFTERKPAISNLRRNLQAEHLQRLFDLANTKTGNAALKPISNLAGLALHDLKGKLETAKDLEGLDAYSRAHLFDMHDRIHRWVEGKVAQSGSGAAPFIIFGSSTEADSGQ